jgi:hypothetical protein
MRRTVFLDACLNRSKSKASELIAIFTTMIKRTGERTKVEEVEARRPK